MDFIAKSALIGSVIGAAFSSTYLFFEKIGIINSKNINNIEQNIFEADTEFYNNIKKLDLQFSIFDKDIYKILKTNLILMWDIVDICYLAKKDDPSDEDIPKYHNLFQKYKSNALLAFESLEQEIPENSLRKDFGVIKQSILKKIKAFTIGVESLFDDYINNKIKK
jgi:hypothetical protein